MEFAVIPAGSLVAGYRVRRVIGSGGMGTIYAVDDPQLPRLDALKVLSAELSADAKFRIRFTREADIAAGLDHPNIVSIYDRGETSGGQLWIAMQLVDGTDADAAIHTGAMTPRRAVHIISKVAEALDYAHARHVLHRDIKPANFLLTGPVGDDERVLLGDFGIARAADDAGLTGTNMVMATVAYAAPEALDGRQIDYRADLYSLGCALFHLLTGEVPYAETTGAAAQAMAHLQRPPPRVSTLVPGLPPKFDTVIGTAMAKDPARRFQSGRALAAAAVDALRDRDNTTDRLTPRRPHGAPPANTPTGQPGPPARRRRGKIIGAAAGVTMLAVAGLTVAVVAGGRDDGPPAPPQVTASTAATSAVPTVAGADLASLMLPADRISAAVGAAARAEPDPWTKFADDGWDKCTGTVFPFQKNTYQASGATDKYAEKLTGVKPDTDVNTVQGVVAFPSADLAAKYVARQRELWPRCAYQSVRVAPGAGKPVVTWRIGAVDTTTDIMTATATKDGTNTDCQHALTAANNIVVDVIACSPDKTDPGVTIARAIADGIPH